MKWWVRLAVVVAVAYGLAWIGHRSYESMGRVNERFAGWLAVGLLALAYWRAAAWLRGR